MSIRKRTWEIVQAAESDDSASKREPPAKSGEWKDPRSKEGS